MLAVALSFNGENSHTNIIHSRFSYRSVHLERVSFRKALKLYGPFLKIHHIPHHQKGMDTIDLEYRYFGG